MGYVIPPPARASVAVRGGDLRFAVRRIFCVGRNYAAHVREMGNDTREPPFFFCKPADALVQSGQGIGFPCATNDLHHEVELVVAIGTGGADIPVAEASGHVWGYGAGIDLTRRDLQAVAKEAGRPWDMAKGFDRSAPCAPLCPVAECGNMERGAISLWVNGNLRQSGDLGDMIWSVPEIIARLSQLVALAPGDLIYTGTPAGVGPLKVGDQVRVEIAGLEPLTLSLA